jgi:ParB/RepB/Spo0J family partition protein
MQDTALADPATTTESHGSAIEGARYLALTLLKPSPTNPRTHFDDAYIQDLAASIKKVGVMQAIVARPLPDAKPGGPQFEIVAGECRWRASGVAGQIVIPALVKDLNDLEVMEFQLLENIKRKDLHPLEEARGYHQMLLDPPGGPKRMRGYTVEQLADKAGVSVRQIYVTIQLLKLIPDAQTAMFEGKLTRSVGLLIARMPEDVQQKALANILRGWAGEPYSYRQAAEYLQQNFMLALARAPFDVKADDLLPGAGACSACPKRTGANPDLFEDVKSADTCTDPECFAGKKKAAGERQIEEARANGLQVLTGDAAKKMMPHGLHSLVQNGYVRLDQPAEDLTGTRKQLQTLLGDDVKPTLVQTEYMDQPIPVVKLDQAKAALKTKGLLKPSVPSRPGQKAKPITAEDLKKQRTARIREKMEQRAPAHLWKHLQGKPVPPVGLPSALLGMLIERLNYSLYSDWTQRLLDVSGLQKAGTGRAGYNELGKVVAKESVATLNQVLTLFLLADILENNSNEAELEAFAKALKWPVSKLLAEITSEVDGAIRDEIEALKSAVAPVKSTKKPAAKPAGPRAAGASTPPKSAPAQGAKTAPKPTAKKATTKKPATPLQALKQAVAKDEKGQKDEPAAPASNGQATAPTVPQIGDTWRVKSDAKGRSKTQGREGAVVEVDFEGKVAILKWGPKSWERGRYNFDEIEFAKAATASGGTHISPVAAWPFPNRPD